MELRRDIYQELIKWKKNDSGKVLELEGERQMGKIFIILRMIRMGAKIEGYDNRADEREVFKNP